MLKGILGLLATFVFVSGASAIEVVVKPNPADLAADGKPSIVKFDDSAIMTAAIVAKIIDCYDKTFTVAQKKFLTETVLEMPISEFRKSLKVMQSEPDAKGYMTLNKGGDSEDFVEGPLASCLGK